MLVTVDQLRVFIGLADCLNLSQLSRHLQMSRQTVRRHLDELERLQGRKLFRVEERQYHLTSAGKALYSDAAQVIKSVERLSFQDNVRVQKIEGLEHASFVSPDGQIFYSQQHIPSKLLESGSPLMRKVLEAWGSSVGHLKNEAMNALRPHVVIYRRTKTGWIFAEVGQKSGYARWFGVDFAMSAMGMPFEEDGVSDSYNSFIAHAYNEVHEHGGVRLDHVYAKLKHPSDQKIKPLAFQRLLAGVSLANNQRALLMASVLTNRLEIDALSERDFVPIGEELIMDLE